MNIENNQPRKRKLSVKMESSNNVVNFNTNIDPRQILIDLTELNDDDDVENNATNNDDFDGSIICLGTVSIPDPPIHLTSLDLESWNENEQTESSSSSSFPFSTVSVTSISDYLNLPSRAGPKRKLCRKRSQNLPLRIPGNTTSAGINIIQEEQPLIPMPKAIRECITLTVPSPSSSSQSEGRIIKCPVCFDDETMLKQTSRQLMSTNCGHIFCDSCIKASIKAQKNCPSCRKQLTVKQIHPIYL